MKIFCDDGSTNVKLAWFEGKALKSAVSVNSFRHNWKVEGIGSSRTYNYLLEGRKYTYDPVSEAAINTTHIEYQYSDTNVLAVHHALLNSGIEPQEIELTVTLPISEFYTADCQKNTLNIERKISNLMREVTLNKGATFTIKSVEVMPESLPAVFTRLVADNVGQYEKSLVIDLGGTTLDVGVIVGQFEDVSAVHGNPELSISCPFVITLTLMVEDQVKSQNEANLKFLDLEKKSKTSYAKYFPSVEKEVKEWGDIRQRLSSNSSSLVSYFFNVTAYTEDDPEAALATEQEILNSFRKGGFELIAARYQQMRNFLSILPFKAGEGIFKELQAAGVVRRAESFNVANLMPVVADSPLAPSGLLAPTYRNQLAFIDLFYTGMNNTNFNMAVCGTSGAGKTGLIQPLIRSVIDAGGYSWVLLGTGYRLMY